MSALRILEPAEIGMLLSIEYKLVFDKILFQEVCDYLSADCPTVSVHVKVRNGVQHLATPQSFLKIFFLFPA